MQRPDKKRGGSLTPKRSARFSSRRLVNRMAMQVTGAAGGGGLRSSFARLFQALKLSKLHPAPGQGFPADFFTRRESGAGVSAGAPSRGAKAARRGSACWCAGGPPGRPRRGRAKPPRCARHSSPRDRPPTGAPPHARPVQISPSSEPCPARSVSHPGCPGGSRKSSARCG